MKTKLNFLMIITLLLGLVLSSPAQNVLAATATDIAYFNFTSSLPAVRLREFLR
jgi:hypothetical protein